jgi:putative spermidine/putrescine transport system substrate-binding protein
MSASRIRVIAAAVLVLLTVSLGGARAADFHNVTLRVAHFGGSYMRDQQLFVARIFEQLTGAKVEWIEGNPPDHLAKIIASRGMAPPFDLVYLESYQQAQAIDQGLLEKIDPAAVPNLRDVYPQAMVAPGYGPGVIIYSMGLIYNERQFKRLGLPAPTSWKVLWDPKLAGHVGTQDINAVTGQHLLVAAALLNGGDETKVEPGIEALSKVKFHSFSASAADLQTKLVNGDVWAAIIINGRAWNTIDQKAPVRYVLPDNGNGTAGFGAVTTLDVVKGSPNKAAAEAFINTVLSPGSQLGQSLSTPYAPSVRTLEKLLALHPDVQKRFPSPDELKKLYWVKWTKAVRDAYPQWADQWNRRVKR